MIKTTIDYTDFAKLDLRVGTIIEAEEVTGSEKLVKMTVDLGEEVGKRTILAGIKAFYPTKDLIARQLIILVNLAPKKMLTEESQGMLLAADINGKPFLLKPDEEVPPGTVIK